MIGEFGKNLNSVLKLMCLFDFGFEGVDAYDDACGWSPESVSAVEIVHSHM